MRSLVVTPMLPVQSAADLGGKHRRAGVFLRALGRLSSDIHLVYMVPERMLALASDPARLNASQSDAWQVPVRVTLIPRRARPLTRWNYYGAGIFSASEQTALYPYGGTTLVRQIGQCLDSDPDLVFADRLDAAIPILASGRRPKRLFIDVDDIYHRVHLRSALRPPFRAGNGILSLQTPALVLAEYRAIRHATLAFVCSSADATHLQRLGFPKQIRIVPNAIDIPPVPPGVPEAPTLLYLGSYHHPPNIVAAERLIGRIWPLIRAQVPDARLLIAGTDSERLPSRTAGIPGVEFPGFVEDLTHLYAESRVICAPITTGSGTRLKLLEGAAYARPMVSTRIGAEGLDFREGREIMLREDDASLAKACIALLDDDALCRRLGLAARAMVQDRYEVRHIEQQVAEQIEAACQTV
jgi:glycosyltransferase involved in cell wall biosynthesis